MPEITITANQSAEVRENAPSQNFSTGTIVATRLTNFGANKYAPVKFPHAEILMGKRLLDAKIKFYIENISPAKANMAPFFVNEFNENMVTYNNLEFVRYSSNMYLTSFLPMVIGLGTPVGYIEFSIWNIRLNDLKERLVSSTYFAINEYGVGFTGGFDIRSTRYAGFEPKLTIVYEDASPKISGQVPKNVFLNDEKENRFQWNFRNDMIIGKEGAESQTAYKFEWRVKDSATINETIVESDNKYHDVPAGTLPAKANLQWRINAQSENGLWSNYQVWFDITTEETATSTAETISPVNAYVDASQPQGFAWRHIIDTGTLPTKSELEYRVGTGTWISLHIMNGAETTAIIPANTLPGGNIQWRVRTFNTDDLPGAWSEPASIVAQGAPHPPEIVGITKSASPTINWQSSGQVAYELVVRNITGTVYATGEIPGTVKSHKIKALLADGAYTAQLRILSSVQMWSRWSSVGFTIETTKPLVPTIKVERIPNGIRITGLGQGSLYLLRDGEPIARFDAGKYDDYTALGTHEYKIRSISGDGYADSVPETITAYVDAFTIASVDEPNNWIALEVRRGERPRVSGNIGFTGGSHNFAGRKLPVYVFSEFQQEERNVAFSFRHPSDWVRMKSLLERRETMICRDLRGNRYFGVVPSASIEQDAIGSDFTLPIISVDYVEVIAYDYEEVTG